MKTIIENEIRHYKAIGATDDIAAMWLASDFLRKMGVDERKECLPAIQALWPEAYEIIKSMYPHYC